MAYLAEQMEKAAGDGDISYIIKNYDDLIYEHEQLCMDLEHLLANPSVCDMISVTVETEQEFDSYMAEAEQFLQEVELLSGRDGSRKRADRTVTGSGGF